MLVRIRSRNEFAEWCTCCAQYVRWEVLTNSRCWPNGQCQTWPAGFLTPRVSVWLFGNPYQWNRHRADWIWSLEMVLHWWVSNVRKNQPNKMVAVAIGFWQIGLQVMVTRWAAMKNLFFHIENRLYQFDSIGLSLFGRNNFSLMTDLPWRPFMVRVLLCAPYDLSTSILSIEGDKSGKSAPHPRHSILFLENDSPLVPEPLR